MCVGRDPSAPTMVCSPRPKPSMNTISQRCWSSGRQHSAASRSAVAATNRRNTADLLVEVAACSTASPTGSRVTG